MKTFWGPVHYTGKFTINGKVHAKILKDDVPEVIDVGNLCQDFVTGRPVSISEVTVDGEYGPHLPMVE